MADQPHHNRSPYEVRLSGSVQNILLVGIISLLRDRPYVRGTLAVAGSVLLVAAVALYLIPFPLFVSDVKVALLVAGIGSTSASVLSGSGFDVYLGEPRETEERERAEEEITDPKDPYGSLDLSQKRLNEYYAINQSQARGSFRWAVFAMFCGLATIVAGVWIFYLGEVSDTFLTSLSTAAGIIINAVSGLYLYLHNRTQRRALYYYGQLVRTQQLGLAIRLAENHTDETERTNARNRVIDQILGIVEFASNEETKAIARETD